MLTIAWLPVLLAAEAARPRFAYGLRRWSTVFPIGMYAACSVVVAAAISAAGIRELARIWVWVGVAAWLLAFIAVVRRGSKVVVGGPFPEARPRLSPKSQPGSDDNVS